MPATKKILNPDISNIRSLGIIAGAGMAPDLLLQACDQKNIECFVIAFEEQTNPEIVEGRKHLWSNPASIGVIIKTLKNHNISDLVFIGAMRRPSIAELKPDLKAAEFLTKLGMSAMGDNDFLGAIREFLSKEGFRLHGVHKFAEDLLAPEGPITKTKPKKADQIDIERGLEISQALGTLDIGQSVIVQEGLVLGVEAIEGTDTLIDRCIPLKRKGRGGVLVKTCKPDQDRDLDLPTIGPDTIDQLAHGKFNGVVVQAGESLILEREEVIRRADKHKIFVVGVSLDTPS